MSVSWLISCQMVMSLHVMTAEAIVFYCLPQVDEVLKLLNELLPPISREQNIQLAADKEHFLINHPDLLQKFGFDLFPVLIQVVSLICGIYISLL